MAAKKAKEEEERLKKEAEEKARKEAEEKARKEAEEKARQEAEERARKEAEERARKEAEERARKEAEERARKEAEERARKEAEERARREAEERAKKEAEARAKKEAEERAAPSLSSLVSRLESKKEEEIPAASPGTAPLRPGGAYLRPGGGGGLRPGGPPPGLGLRPGGAGLRPGAPLRPGGGVAAGSSRSGSPSTTSAAAGGASASNGSGDRARKKRRVYSKAELLRFRDLDICCCRPQELPDMTIQRGGNTSTNRRSGRGGEGGGNQWARTSMPPNGTDNNRGGPNDRRSNRGNRNNNGGDQWKRGQEAPKPRPNNRSGGRSNRGNRNDHHQDEFDGPVAPLVMSENRWMPSKDDSSRAKTEKSVKSILNKMTKEKFERLSNQMCDIPIISYEVLTLMIHLVYEKAITEPTFGDMYADLCVKLSQRVKRNTFVKIIPSDEEPPTEDVEGFVPGRTSTSGNTVYRWSNDVSVTDAEIVGPHEDPESCLRAALDQGNAPTPIKRGDMELELHSLQIKEGMFVKIMKPVAKEGEDEEAKEEFYTVFFPLEEAEKCGQQLSKIFLSERECENDGSKQNSFKRSLLNKCEDEFNKQDIYVDWKKEKKEYEDTKASLTESKRNEIEDELDFRRMKIKKQMLGNIRFIGELFKKNMLKERIMRYCIHSLLKVEENEKATKKTGSPVIRSLPDDEMDAEDHEALCNLFTTIGKTIDTPDAYLYMKYYFNKIETLSNDKRIETRSRFMYKDLIELRGNRWKMRREQETAKTLDEIRKDAEREERAQEQQSQRSGGGYRGGGGRGGGRGDRDDRRDRGDRRGGGGGDYRSDRRGGGGGGGSTYGGSRQRSTPQRPSVDEHGFTQVGGRSASARVTSGPPRVSAPVPRSQRMPPAPAAPAPPVSKSSPAPTSGALPSPFTEEKLKNRAKSMRAEFMQDRSNVEDLLFSMDETRGTPDAGKTIVQVNVDHTIDCKDNERDAIIAMLVILFEKGKLSRSDFEGPMADIVEFIDSYVCDSPRVMEYLGDMLAAFFKIGALDVKWLVPQCAKVKEINPGADFHTQVITHAIDSQKKAYGVEEAKRCFGGNAEQRELAGLLGLDTWKAISSQKL
mmetsp:Transcript_26792/g.39979  ORF Transcript_26792/g.39979 Transcript_26792/m.39979 type:complete len:1100 (-) Transcript_26792:207-3506(-)